MLVFMLLMKATKVSTKQMKSFIGFALSMAILMFAIKPFASMSWEQYGKAMAGLGGVLLELIAFMGLMKAMKISVPRPSRSICTAMTVRSGQLQ